MEANVSQSMLQGANCFYMLLKSRGELSCDDLTNEHVGGDGSADWKATHETSGIGVERKVTM